MKKYRIKQIAEDIYIPQVKNSFFGFWYGIDQNKKLYLVFKEWLKEEYQNEYCICKSLSQALEVIHHHKIIFKTIDKTKYPIYHKIKNK
jgi:hypothetical protein